MLLPKPNESKPQFIHRAIRYYVEEGYPMKQAVTLAHNAWKQLSGKKKS